TGVLGIGEGHLFHHRKARRLVSGDFAKSGSLFQDFPSRAFSVKANNLTSSSQIGMDKDVIRAVRLKAQADGE
ncbi:hypothetical protein ACNE9Y_32670, partial [Pseudomonas sp. NY11226]|uniref:hypothetical protein n=1 Tax=Pseudomonas sp. NY11226 TaxID=3400362 RepID=UPI003A873EF3